VEPWVIEILKQSPVAGVLGVVVYFLWKKLERSETKSEAAQEKADAREQALQDEIQALLTQRAQENAQRYADIVKALGERRAIEERPSTSYSHTTRTNPTRGS
jgi:hypothetical protein